MQYLVKWNAMNKAIEEAHNIDEVKLIRDEAEAIRYALIQAKASPEYVRMAEEIKLNAERRGGGILKEQVRKPGETNKKITFEGQRLSPTLEEMEITYRQSFDWQKINGIPNEDYFKYIKTQYEKKKQITTSGAVKLAKKLQRESEFEGTPELPEGKYNVLYADPPWKYGDKLVESYGAVEHHYTSMTNQELCDLDIKSIADDNAVLFLWVTSPLLEECFSVIKAWGFKYKASFVWDKVKHNWGHYNSVRHEFLLICIRGTFLPQSKELHDSVISIERSKEHSKKPEYFRELIEKMYPKSKKIELFARQKTRDWQVWGAEI